METVEGVATKLIFNKAQVKSVFFLASVGGHRSTHSVPPEYFFKYVNTDICVSW